MRIGAGWCNLIRWKNLKAFNGPIACVSLLLPFTLSFRTQAAGATSNRAREFVQSFYDWYTPLACSRPDSEQIALRAKSGDFTHGLARSLRLDLEAQAHADRRGLGYIVGLDFDPFMNSQDPDKRYSIGTVAKKGRTYWVSLHRVVRGKVLAKVAVVAEVIEVKGRFRFSDFFYPDTRQGLLGYLRLQAEECRSESQSKGTYRRPLRARTQPRSGS